MEVLISTLKEMVLFIKDWGALIIAGISLLVAIISLFKSSKAQRLQNKVNELELNGSASKFRITTKWTASSGNQHTKTQMGDFS